MHVHTFLLYHLLLVLFKIRKPVPSVRHLLKINYQLNNLVEREIKQQNKQRKINSELRVRFNETTLQV